MIEVNQWVRDDALAMNGLLHQAAVAATEQYIISVNGFHYTRSMLFKTLMR